MIKVTVTSTLDSFVWLVGEFATTAKATAAIKAHRNTVHFLTRPYLQYATSEI